MTAASSGIGFIVPDLGRPSGGSVYNERVSDAWPPAAALEVRTVALGNDLRARFAAALRMHPVSLVDGLIGSEHPDLLRAAVEDGHRVVLLVHMPRPADTGLTDTDRARLAGLESAAVETASQVVVPSTWAATDLRSRYARRDLVVAIPGVDRAPVAGRHDPPAILQLGAIGPLKNQLLTARAARACRDLDFRLRVVGPVVDQAYADQVAALLPDQASLLPAVTGPARDDLLAGTDLMVSVATRESYGLTVVEGLARGIPAVVGAGTGAVEALAAGGIGAGEPGVATATDDPAALAAVLRSFLTDPQVRDQWRTSALAARESLPGWDSTAGTIAAACGVDVSN